MELEDALVPALIVEELEDGSYTVLVPSAPTPMAGSVYILPRDRVHPVDIPFTQAIGVFSKWGTGAGEFVRAMRDKSRSRPDRAYRSAVFGDPASDRRMGDMPKVEAGLHRTWTVGGQRPRWRSAGQAWHRSCGSGPA